MKLVSWNVNGIRACITKGFYEFFEEVNADIFCVQESKMQEGQIEILSNGYLQYFNSADKKGYSSTIVFTKVKPLSVTYDLPQEEHRHEGRVIILEYDSFYLINVYTPNSKEALARIDYRMQWEDDFKAHIKLLEETKPVIVCGDLNVAHQEIDLKNPKANRKNPGFSDQERGKMNALLDSGMIDTYRYLNPDKEGAYTWWSYRFSARTKNIGWRIDYFLTSQILKDNIQDAEIYADVLGSDHCPISLTIDVA